jgi:CheY-like chemotaxis protein
MHMNDRPLSPTRLLVVDDDNDLRVFLQDFLIEEGYEVDVGATMDEALSLIDTKLYHLILTDLLSHSSVTPLRSALTISTHARPTPVAALTGWNISAAEVKRAGLVELIAKPFDLTDLLATVSAHVEMRLTPDQRRHAEALRQFCDAINAGDVEACLAVCVDDLRINAPDNPLGEPAEPLAGRIECSRFIRSILRSEPAMRFDDYLIYPHDRGLALRYQKSWSASGLPGDRATMSGAMFVQFTDGRIGQINMQAPDLAWSAFPSSSSTIGRQQDSQT